VDLVFTQNGAGTALFHNEASKRGLRVRLRGPAGNPLGIGAVVRAIRNGDRGPSQTVTAGGGYWSQPGQVQVMTGDRPETVEVRWTDGKTTRHPVPNGLDEFTAEWATTAQ
jgi:hypothetical protein